MARIKVVPRKPPDRVLTPTSRPRTPSSGITIRDESTNPRERSVKKEATPTTSQEPPSMIKNDAERKDKGKKHALEIPAKDEVQRLEDDEETETDEEDDEDPHAKLIDELESFQRWGLMNKRDPNQVSSSVDEEDSSEEGQCYEVEVRKKYPNFLLFIPQNPHYRGLLHDGVDEGIKKTVHQALWYKLVDLMDKALQTNCFSRPWEIRELMQEARGLEKLGFDVRHLIARLEKPARNVFDLRLANDQLHLAKKRKQETEEQLTELDMLEAEADKLKKMLSDVEAKVSRLKAKVGSKEERAALLTSLRKQVEDAEKILLAKLDIFKSLH